MHLVRAGRGLQYQSERRRDAGGMLFVGGESVGQDQDVKKPPCVFFFFLMMRPPRSSPLFPTTPLFRPRMIRPTVPADTPALLAITQGTGLFLPIDLEALDSVLAAYHEENAGAGHRCFTYEDQGQPIGDRKSTRLNSSHLVISYTVFCLK